MLLFSNHHFQANLRLTTKGLAKELKDHMGGNPKIGGFWYPKMDGENHGKPY